MNSRAIRDARGQDRTPIATYSPLPSGSPLREDPTLSPELIWAPGQVETAASQIDVYGQVAGKVVSVPVELGDWVEVGVTLAQIDPAEYRWNVELARAELQGAESNVERIKNGSRSMEIQAARAELAAIQSQLEHAKKTLERNRFLAASGSISASVVESSDFAVRGLNANESAKKAVVDRLELGFRKEVVRESLAGLAAAKAKLRLAEIQLDRTRIVAPIEGQVLRLDVHAGDVVGSSDLPLALIGDTREMHVRAWIDDRAASRVTLGANATVTVDGLEDREFAGEVSSISPMISPRKVKTYNMLDRSDAWTREAWVKLSETSGLIPGMRVDVRFSPNSF